MIINPASYVVYQSPLCTVVNTGGWFDIYVAGQHYTGTMNAEKAKEIFSHF